MLETPHLFLAPSLAGQTWVDHGFGKRSFTPGGEIRTIRQVHSNRVVVEGEAREGCEGDALVSNQRGVRVGVKTADCVPILLADPRTRAVAAVHAGWRGTAAGIVQEAVKQMKAAYGSSAADIIAAVGPAIGACCYEVGPEVVERLRPYLPEAIPIGRHAKIDLAAANRQQLRMAGIPPEQITVAELCTRCRAHEFHSFRRDGKRCGRLISFIGVRD